MKRKMLAIFLLAVLVVNVCSCDFTPNDKIDKETSDTKDSESLDNDHEAEILSISIATEEQLSKDGYTHFYDQYSLNTEWKIVVTINAEIESFSFIEVDDSDKAEIGKVLFEEESPVTGSLYIIHTYINDAGLNRGISYKDKNGHIRYFGIDFSMDDGSLNLIELKI